MSKVDVRRSLIMAGVLGSVFLAATIVYNRTTDMFERDYKRLTDRFNAELTSIMCGIQNDVADRKTLRADRALADAIFAYDSGEIEHYEFVDRLDVLWSRANAISAERRSISKSGCTLSVYGGEMLASFKYTLTVADAYAAKNRMDI